MVKPNPVTRVMSNSSLSNLNGVKWRSIETIKFTNFQTSLKKKKTFFLSQIKRAV